MVQIWKTFFFMLIFVLPGCASRAHPIITSAAPTGIVYRVTADHLDKTRKLAMQHCANHRKKARYEQVTEAGTEDVIAAFRCA